MITLRRDLARHCRSSLPLFSSFFPLLETLNYHLNPDSWEKPKHILINNSIWECSRRREFIIDRCTYPAVSQCGRISWNFRHEERETHVVPFRWSETPVPRFFQRRKFPANRDLWPPRIHKKGSCVDPAFLCNSFLQLIQTICLIKKLTLALSALVRIVVVAHLRRISVC